MCDTNSAKHFWSEKKGRHFHSVLRVNTCSLPQPHQSVCACGWVVGGILFPSLVRYTAHIGTVFLNYFELVTVFVFQRDFALAPLT
jgi:hypothetical protein